jgi:hypothetical protein
MPKRVRHLEGDDIKLTKLLVEGGLVSTILRDLAHSQVRAEPRCPLRGGAPCLTAL